MIPFRFLPAGLALSLGCGIPTRAALVWRSDFESYNTAGGAIAALVVDNTGDDDTFTLAAPSVSLAGGFSQIVSATGVPAFMSGNALYLGGISEAAAISFGLRQNALPLLNAGGVSVASFDIYNVSVSVVSLIGEVRTRSGRSGNTIYNGSTQMRTPVRVTLVVNRTGADIALPGTLGPLPTDSAALYRFDGKSYSKLAASLGNVASDGATGFATGFSLSSSAVGSTYGLWFDNFGVWDSASDLVDGVSVLSLAPGSRVPTQPRASR